MNAAPLSPEDPTELRGFELLGRIGHGGTGQVHLGESPGGEAAAVKVIKPSMVDSGTRLRFAQEIEVLKTIWGPRIAAFLDADAEAEQPWPATEYIDGPDLRKHINTRGPLPMVPAASVGATLAEALAGVHAQGLLHRDLKPANIFLGPNGPKTIDFGLAAFTESSVSLTAPNTVLGPPPAWLPSRPTVSSHSWHPSTCTSSARSCSTRRAAITAHASDVHHGSPSAPAGDWGVLARRTARGKSVRAESHDPIAARHAWHHGTDTRGLGITERPPPATEGRRRRAETSPPGVRSRACRSKRTPCPSRSAGG
ncbi:serine/threonine-protein kinase [Streptomyces sp. NPDC058467]|uniref:serine/threonine-protein kinase n=1 Tax=unclassified Streptomyces TaxID=2593676 RepID=UPI0036695C9C